MLIWTVVCLRAAPRALATVSCAIIIASCQSAATSEIAKHFTTFA